MSTLSKSRQGFTLVELVVVILILGILAGVAAPKLFKTSGDATDNGLRQTLAVIRDAIELYAAQNNGALPPCPDDGSGDDSFHDSLKPYLRGEFPACPVGPKPDNLITAVNTDEPTGEASPGRGWKYSTSDGTFICGYNGPTASNNSVTSDQL